LPITGGLAFLLEERGFKMEQRLVHPKSNLKGIVLTSVVLLLLQATQISLLAVQPQVAAGEAHTIGVKSDGTVVAVGANSGGQINVGSWTDIVDVAAGGVHTVGVKSDIL
jgi:alpha-tubulin suppressor-like RCC1 family protein